MEFISIPFSTIKRNAKNNNAKALYTFQFHLVRLKENLIREINKSLKFQFHLVRLKAALERYQCEYDEFQFHLVRLKALIVVLSVLPYVYFNSI